MKHRRISTRRIAVTGASVAALVVAGISLQSANASTDVSAESLSATAAGKLASSLTKDLGSEAAGSYYDAQSKHLVVNVLNQDAASAVESAGAKAKVVDHSLAELKGARATLKDKASIPGTAWSVDNSANKVVVTVDRTVKGAELAKLNKVVDQLGSKVQLKHSKGEFKSLIAGGDAIWGGGGRCSLGFNVTVGGEPHFLTAGHCTEAITSWSESQGGPVIGENAGSSFPGNDFGLVKYTGDTAHPSEVDLYNGSTQAIAGASEATEGQQVTRSGSTTQVHDGTVTGLNATVNYAEGTVEGLIQTDVCAEPGDSGGSLFAGDQALGLTSGGSGDCSAGGETFFQPVPEALSEFGAEIG
ncbi:S1 family peptidase [Streptomyces physcomitrii]|uniref:S1 family peptidase n=1 Tax=Streptomyces physcomitrii TaxID=2724184 RepID=A0ABX1H4X9_9ACTN|nr:alpha-lytic protease prodomain-containing protein [Streptomyces physcomitrii]NKI43419.1 S1 family peptidase [Streptomyces physcomitrii]